MSTEQLYNKLGNQLKYFIYQRVNDQVIAEDILHDVFIKIHNSIGTLKNPAKMESWVFQVTRNAIIDYYRKEKKLTLAIDNEETISVKEEETNENHRKASKGLTEMVEELPPIYKEAIFLTEYEGLTQKQLAEKMNISLTGAKSRVQRAKKMLKDMLLQCCHFEYDKYGTVIDYCKACCCCSPDNKPKKC